LNESIQELKAQDDQAIDAFSRFEERWLNAIAPAPLAAG
jgi:hypothetical protein